MQVGEEHAQWHLLPFITLRLIRNTIARNDLTSLYHNS